MTPDAWNRQARRAGSLFVPRWVQLAALPVLLLIAWFTLGAIGQVVFIFLVAGLVALVLNPLVHGLERVRVPRYVGVFLVYVGFVAVVVLSPCSCGRRSCAQLRTLSTALPGMADQAAETIARLQRLADRADSASTCASRSRRRLNGARRPHPAVHRRTSSTSASPSCAR